MTRATCPYCRGSIAPEEGNELACPGCGTPHHVECYAENGGCTVFGCSAAPAEEPKLSVTEHDLRHQSSPGEPAPSSPTLGLPTMLPAVSCEQQAAPAVRVKAAPPPLPAQSTASSGPASTPIRRFGSGSVLFGTQPVAAVASAASAAPISFDADPEAKERMTFIILGLLLGAFGAHNFYAGYKSKAVAQLGITVLSLGFASPMSWVWAVIDVCTVDKDNRGIKFRS